MGTPGRTLLEVCVDTVDGCLAAEAGGADRVELCAGLSEGGTTPSAGELELALERSKLDLMVMVRPRRGDFLYTPVELEVMRRDVVRAREAGAAGIVAGILLPDGTVDRERTAELVELARPLPFTFHRAFDVARDRSEALDTLIELGIERVLTSGGAEDALTAADAIAALVERAAGRIVVMPGGGIGPTNVVDLVRRTGVSEVHTSAGVTVESGMRSRNATPRMGAEGALGEYELVRTDERVVRACVDALAGA